jgi:hypothetical protein
MQASAQRNRVHRIRKRQFSPGPGRQRHNWSLKQFWDRAPLKKQPTSSVSLLLAGIVQCSGTAYSSEPATLCCTHRPNVYEQSSPVMQNRKEALRTAERPCIGNGPLTLCDAGWSCAAKAAAPQLPAAL